MSYHEQAEGINKDLQSLFNSINIKDFTQKQREDILNIIIRFGRVAKYRCRSNIAYENFTSACFQDIAIVSWVEIEGKEYKSLRADIK